MPGVSNEFRELREIQGDREWVVVGSGYGATHPRFAGANWSSREDPIDRSSGLQERAGRRWEVLIRKYVQKLRLTDRGGSRFAGDIEIEVASEHDRGACVVSPGIVQGLAKLGAAQRIIALTLQVQVISDKPFPRDGRFAYQCQASSNSFLKRFDVGQEPARTPEIRLLLKSQDPRIR